MLHRDTLTRLSYIEYRTKFRIECIIRNCFFNRHDNDQASDGRRVQFNVTFIRPVELTLLTNGNARPLECCAQHSNADYVEIPSLSRRPPWYRRRFQPSPRGGGTYGPRDARRIRHPPLTGSLIYSGIFAGTRRYDIYSPPRQIQGGDAPTPSTFPITRVVILAMSSISVVGARYFTSRFNTMHVEPRRRTSERPRTR